MGLVCRIPNGLDEPGFCNMRLWSDEGRMTNLGRTLKGFSCMCAWPDTKTNPTMSMTREPDSKSTFFRPHVPSTHVSQIWLIHKPFVPNTCSSYGKYMNPMSPTRKLQSYGLYTSPVSSTHVSTIMVYALCLFFQPWRMFNSYGMYILKVLHVPKL